MKQITGLTAEVNQSMNLVLPDGSKASFELSYWDGRQGWYYSISYGTWTGLINKRLKVNPNFLRAYRGIIPFGLACNTRDGLEPLFIDDFISGRATLYLLDSTDVQTYEGRLIQDYLFAP